MARPKKENEYTIEIVDDIADEMVKYYKQNKEAVTLDKFFVIHKDMHANIPKRFSEKSEYFKRKLKDVKKIIANRLVEGGLTNNYNASFTKFILSVNHGMSEVQQIEQKTELTVKTNLTDLFNEIDEENNNE